MHDEKENVNESLEMLEESDNTLTSTTNLESDTSDEEFVNNSQFANYKIRKFSRTPMPKIFELNLMADHCQLKKHFPDLILKNGGLLWKMN